MRVSLTGGRGLALAAALLISTSAFAAPDATKIANSVVASLQAKGGAKATFDSAVANGDDVVITNMKVTRDGDEITVPSLVISSPVERTPGGFTAKSIAFDNGTTTNADQTITWKTGITQDATIPDPSEMHSTAKLTPFSHFEIDSVTIAQKDKPQSVTIDSVALDFGDVVDGSPNQGKLAITGIPVGMMISTFAEDDSAKGVLAALGYDNLVINVTVEGSYDTAKQALTIGGITIDGKDLGKLAIGGTFGGLPRDKLQSADHLKELAPTATIETAEIRFDDDGLTNRVLDMQAQQMGGKREDLVAMVPGFLPLAFTQANITNEQFQQQVTAAVSAFLKEPKSLVIKVAPATPVPLMEVGKAAMTDPNSVLTLLSVGVSANN